VRLKDLDTGLLLDTSLVQLNWSYSNRTLVLTFPGQTGASLTDGNYRIVIESGQLAARGVALDGNNDGTQGGAYAFDFHRFFGDLSGNRTVDTLDGYQFRYAYNTTFGSAGYLPGLDYNSDGVIDTVDRIPFEDNFRQTFYPAPESALPGTPPDAFASGKRLSSPATSSSDQLEPASSVDAPSGGFSVQSGSSYVMAAIPPVTLEPLWSPLSLFQSGFSGGAWEKPSWLSDGDPLNPGRDLLF